MSLIGFVFILITAAGHHFVIECVLLPVPVVVLHEVTKKLNSTTIPLIDFLGYGLVSAAVD